MPNHALFEDFLTYARLDEAEDETVVRDINTVLSSAELILVNSGVKMPKDFHVVVNGVDVFSQHRLAILLLAIHYHENRIATTNMKNELPYGVQTMILQLKWVNPDELSAQQ